MNKVILIGRLTADPEHKTTPSGLSVVRFTLAVERRFKSSDGNRAVDFISIVVWRQLADLCARYLNKGKKVAVAGQIQSRSYDARDGSKRYVTEVIADEVEFITPKLDGSQFGSESTHASDNSGSDGFTEVEDDELPF